MTDEQTWWEPYALRIAELLTGQTLIDGDRVIDEVRRIAWGSAFEGITGAETAEAQDASPLARTIARELEGLGFGQVNTVLGMIRLATWRARYAERRDVSGGAPRHPGDTEPASLH